MGKSNRIYKRVDYYKNITSCIEKLAKSKEMHKDNFEVYFIKNRKLNPNVFGKNYVILMFRNTIKNLNSSIIYKYTPVCTKWDWGYWKCRYQLKSIIYICEKLDIPMNGYDMTLKSIENISGGLVFPEAEINKMPITYTWYPEDYIDYLTESMQAKETEETDFIMKYIEDEGYLKYFHRIRAKRFEFAGENE